VTVLTGMPNHPTGVIPPEYRRVIHFLGAGSGTNAVQTCRVMSAFEPLVAELGPDVVVMVGDVNSTLACALVTASWGAAGACGTGPAQPRPVDARGDQP